MTTKKECVAMLLAGGEGTRLGALTKNQAKPAVHFGGKYRIIDFTLSNCTNSGIGTVGILTQYQPFDLNAHVGAGASWDLDATDGGVSILPPFMAHKELQWYQGTANAVALNIDFIDRYEPEYVLVISGDHIYNMDYSELLEFHKSKGAEATISVVPVKWEEASRFGIMNTDGDDRIVEFVEKPEQPPSNLASMGVYMFSWPLLKRYLQEDTVRTDSSHDFGKDIIPAMLRDKVDLFAYAFEGYWKDVGTIESLWEAHMDLLSDNPALQLNTFGWPLYSQGGNYPPQAVLPEARIVRSMLNDGCVVEGDIDQSVLFYGVEVGKGSMVDRSVIMPNVIIGRNVTIRNAIVGEGTVIEDGTVIGTEGVITLHCGERTPQLRVGALDKRSAAALERIG